MPTPAPPARPWERRHSWGAQPVTLHPRGPRDPRTPGLGSSGAIPAPGASGLHPHPWGRIQPPRATTPNIQAPPKLLLPLVPRARASASAGTRRVIFIPSDPGWGKKKIPRGRALPSGRFGERRARGHYRLKRRDPLWWPKVIPGGRGSRRQNGDGVKAAAEAAARAGKNGMGRSRATQGRGGFLGERVGAPRPGWVPPVPVGFPLSRERGDAGTEPVAFGVTQRGLAVPSCG